MRAIDGQTRLVIRDSWRRDIAANKDFPRRPDPAVKRDLAHGWLLPYLLGAETLLYGRWEYWGACLLTGALPDDPIPPIPFIATEQRANPAHKMLETCLNIIPRHGVWRTWGSWNYFDYFLDWLLYGFGHQGQPEPPAEPAGCEGASNRLYQVFCLEALLAWPSDYFGDLLAENRHGRGLGFYPTPLNVCELMAGMLFGDDRDHRTATVCDPCLGTGRMLLTASNRSLRLVGMDINPTVIKASLVNGFLYAPWLVRPIPWLEGDYANPARSASVSDSLVRAAADNPAAASYLANTHHDSQQQWRFEPIKKRRPVAAEELPLAADPSFADLYRAD